MLKWILRVTAALAGPSFTGDVGIGPATPASMLDAAGGIGIGALGGTLTPTGSIAPYVGYMRMVAGNHGATSFNAHLGDGKTAQIAALKARLDDDERQLAAVKARLGIRTASNERR